MKSIKRVLALSVGFALSSLSVSANSAQAPNSDQADTGVLLTCTLAHSDGFNETDHYEFNSAQNSFIDHNGNLLTQISISEDTISWVVAGCAPDGTECGGPDEHYSIDRSTLAFSETDTNNGNATSDGSPPTVGSCQKGNASQI